MKKILGFFFGTMMIAFGSNAQSVVEAEYYWDHDPGVGMATTLSVASPSGSINETFNVSTAGLSQGNHQLVVRTRNSNGLWSPTFSKDVMVHQFTGTEIFWDEDPGYNNGVALTLNTDDTDVTNTYNVSTVGMREGWHTLYTRTKGFSESWSPIVSQPVYITNKVVGAEYFWNHDPGVGNGTAINIGTSGEEVNFTTDISTVGLDTTVDIHYLVVRTINMANAWSVMLDTALFLGPVGVEDMVHNHFHSVAYPNPARDMATLSLFTLNVKQLNVMLESSSGQTVETIYNGQISGRKDIRMDVSSLSAGIYFLRFRTEDGEWVQRLVVE